MALVATFFSLSSLFFSCEKEVPLPQGDQFLMVDAQGSTRVDGAQLRCQLELMPKQPLETVELNSLQFMREEEKLAHDVYNVFYQQYGSRIFYNISASENTHFAAVGRLLERYDMPDPSSGKALGMFENETLQALFNELTAKGAVSLSEALRVGALIEEIDIRDLQHDLLEVVNNDDIAMVYANLMQGSRNHLRAFVRSLDMLGLTYEPEILSVSEYSDIINSPMERGNQGQ